MSDAHASHCPCIERVRQRLNYGLTDLREYVRAMLGRWCPYCECRLTAEIFSCDHRALLSRGALDVEKLQIVCGRSNQIKGALKQEEFGELMPVVMMWPPDARRDVMARLVAVGRRMR